ncbi:EAL domain-containing protein [Teredinibacter sp. KSP-S5-2]|uniref:bifunctional diguanylate cyclase/phosphodiesterase n=1 Tax=Teredinibacter sp. KSP-S5-2 TaxID=3034506 RepID=UPI00293503A9|nr:EAL domain-containing protein [Teredinibacter sp. KSP-S5-2]WNO08756.1 EAL domain-containing protein [Teredinibacter sp. KSP-S5-2]
MTDNLGDDELMVFAEEPGGGDMSDGEFDGHSVKSWRILITDDEKDVHSATAFALRNTEILGRSLEFHHAYSGRECVEVLKTVKDIAVILLDVVMETPNSGLDMVHVIRNELNIHDSRIILRTGQPNQAPEIEVIRDYDINDYKLKSELNQTKLYAALTTAIRSYNQIRAIEAGKKSLDMLVRASSELLTQKGLHDFAQGVIIHLSGLLSIPPEGLICVRRRFLSEGEESPQIIAAAGHYCSLIDHPLNDLNESEAKSLLVQSLDNRCNVFHKRGLALYLGSDSRGDMSCFVMSSGKINAVDQQLLELFCSNISVCADNLTLVDRLSSYAYYDPLVGLPNRNSLSEEIDRVIKQDDMPDYSLVMVGLDNFSEVNAALGQEYGDKLLKAVGQRLSNRFPVPCTVARISGDTFGIFGPDKHIQQSQILSAFHFPFDIGRDQQAISATAGIVSLQDIEGGGSEAIKDASIVLKLAKQQNRGEVVSFNKNMVVEARERLELLKNLRTAFDEDRLFLAYQPKFDLKTSKLRGFEALLRWQTPEGDLIPPQDFIPLAEQSGLIIRMGEWVLREACKKMAELIDAGWDDIQMSVNYSVAQLLHKDAIKTLKKITEDINIHPSFIELEITESIAMDNVVGVIKLLKSIKELGYALAIDDFGTGFSSLSYLQRMPVDRLKIDQSFIHTSNTEHGREIVEMIIHLGRTLDLKVVAEGVEKPSQLEILKELKCDEVQGFLYAMPMPSDELDIWLENSGGKAQR